MQPTSLVQWVDLLRNTPSKNDKKALLVDFLAWGGDTLREIIKMAYNPEKCYYMSFDKMMAFRESPLLAPLSHGDLMSYMDSLSSRSLSGHEALRTIKSLYHSANDDYKLAIKIILDRSLDCGVDVSTLNAVEPGMIPVFDVMLCTPASEKAMAKIKYPAYAQKKEDAARIIVIVKRTGEVQYRTRNGSFIDFGNPEIDAQFQLGLLGADTDVVLDGEVFLRGPDGNWLTRKASNGVLNKIIKGTKTNVPENEVKFVFWDTVSLDEFLVGWSAVEYKDRFIDVVNIVENIDSEFVEFAESHIVNSPEEAIVVCDNYIKSGFEGIVLKNIDAPYSNTRSPNQVKMKAEETTDLLCVGTIPGEGKYQGMIGALMMEDASGQLKVNVGTGLSDADRNKSPDEYIGKIHEIKYNELIKKKKSSIMSLFLPVYREVRFDKDVADNFGDK